MKFVSAVRNNDQVMITYERGDGTTFSYVTATPERYGFAPPPVDHVARLEKKVADMIATIERMQASVIRYKRALE